MKRIALSPVLSLLIVLLMTVSVLVPQFATNAQAAGSPATLTLGFDESITSANPYVGIFDIDYLFFSLVYDSLITVDENMIPVPNLASSWWHMDGATAYALGSNFSSLTHSDPADWSTGSIWEYNITQGVFWNDGAPFTADDVVWTIDIQIGANFVYYWAYQPYTMWIDHTEKIDNQKMRIFFSDRISGTPKPVAWGDGINIPILPKHIFGSYPDTYVAQSWTGIPAIGTGPFMGTSNLGSELIGQDHVTLVKNPYYNWFDTGDSTWKGLGHAYGRTIKIDNLILKSFADQSLAEQGVRSGAVDCAEISPPTYNSWASDSTFPADLNLTAILSADTYSKVSHFNSNTFASASLSPLRLDPAVQRASALAINKTGIVDTVYDGMAVEGVGIISPASSDWWWSPGTSSSTFNVTDQTGAVVFSYTKQLDHAMDYDIALANQILDAAGYFWSGVPGASVRKAGQLAADRLVALGIIADASTALNLTLDYQDVIDIGAPDEVAIGAYISADWQNIGIYLTPQYVNIGVWNQLVYGFQYIYTESWWSGDPDPNYILFPPTTDAMMGWNEFGTMNSSYDYYFKMQSESFDHATRKNWIDKCLEWQYLSGSMVFTCYPMSCFAFNESKWGGWGDWSTNPRLAMNLGWFENPLWFDLSQGSKPVASFTVSPSMGGSDTVFTVNASASYDNETASAALEVRWDWEDNGTWTAWTTNKLASHEFSASGIYLIRLEVRDGDGELSNTTRTVIVDDSPPITMAQVSGTQGVNGWLVSKQVAVWLNATDGLSGVDSTWYNLTVPGGSSNIWTHYVSRLNLTLEGNYTLQYNSTDNVGNAESTKTVQFKIDSTAPMTDVQVSGSKVTLTTHDSMSGINRTLYRIDGDVWHNYTSAVWVNPSGNHTVDYYSVDNAGNVEHMNTIWVLINAPSNTAGIPVEWMIIIAVIIAVGIALLIMVLRRKPPTPKGEDLGSPKP